MSRIIEFGRLPWISEVDYKFLNINNRVNANISGVVTRKLNGKNICLFCNNNSYNGYSNIFAYNQINKVKLHPDPIYFNNEVFNKLCGFTSLETYGKFTLACTNNEVIYWSTDDETIGLNKVTVKNVYCIADVNTNIMNMLKSVLSIQCTKVNITGMCINMRTNEIIFSIGTVITNDVPKKLNVLVSACISFNNGKIVVSDNFKVVYNYDMSVLLGYVTMSVEITDVCFDVKNNNIMMTINDNCIKGYVAMIKWFDTIKIYSNIPKFIENKNDNKKFTFTQIPLGITMLDDNMLVSFQHDIKSAHNNFFDYLVVG